MSRLEGLVWLADSKIGKEIQSFPMFGNHKDTNKFHAGMEKMEENESFQTSMDSFFLLVSLY